MDGAGVGEYFPEDGSGRNRHQLVREISLPGVRPSVDVVGFELEDEWPDGIGFSLTALCPSRPVLNGHGTDVRCNFCQLLSNRLS